MITTLFLLAAIGHAWTGGFDFHWGIGWGIAAVEPHTLRQELLQTDTMYGVGIFVGMGYGFGDFDERIVNFGFEGRLDGKKFTEKDTWTPHERAIESCSWQIRGYLKFRFPHPILPSPILFIGYSHDRYFEGEDLMYARGGLVTGVRIRAFQAFYVEYSYVHSSAARHQVEIGMDFLLFLILAANTHH
jgi:hypothetical protein